MLSGSRESKKTGFLFLLSFHPGPQAPGRGHTCSGRSSTSVPWPTHPSSLETLRNVLFWFPGHSPCNHIISHRSSLHHSPAEKRSHTETGRIQKSICNRATCQDSIQGKPERRVCCPRLLPHMVQGAGRGGSNFQNLEVEGQRLKATFMASRERKSIPGKENECAET